MILNERFRSFNIKFYEDIETKKVIYESAFTRGEANSLNDAFKEFSRDDFVRDMYYYYDDVVDVRFGRFVPSLDDKIRKGRKYLGMLELELDIDSDQDKGTPEHTVSYLSKHRELIDDHLKYIKNLKDKENIKTLKDKITSYISKLFKKHEMFEPIKSNKAVICEHCGSIIPPSYYFELYRGKSYHLECIWDKLINKRDNNDYENARAFFFKLKEKVGNWPPYGYDIEDDYITDLELVQHNDRRNPQELRDEVI